MATADTVFTNSTHSHFHKEIVTPSNMQRREADFSLSDHCISKSKEILPALPPSGYTEEIGRRAKMEDNLKIQEDLVRYFPAALSYDFCLSIPFGMPANDKQRLQVPKTENVKKQKKDVLHFYGVYDGHGGSEASIFCAENLHLYFKEAWKRQSKRKLTFSKKKKLVKEFSAADSVEFVPESTSFPTSEDIREIFSQTFKKTNEEFKSDDMSLIGSTAVAALVGQLNIFVGYCGDSRAVLCRNGTAIPLTIDHKPERPDEIERIRSKGGQVLYFNGARVMGLLAMSRAIGDSSLKPYVTHEPEVTIIQRSIKDQVLILATDGLWDVIGNQEACNIALRCLKRAVEKGASRSEAARLTSAVLVKAAGTRGSRDNITVIVVDLRVENNEILASDQDGVTNA